MNDTSLYIPCFNAQETIAVCLEAVFKLDYPLVEVVVVDDGSTDMTVAIAGAYPVRFLRHDVNRGLSAARNTAIGNMSTPFIASLDADCIAEPDWLSRLMRKFDSPAIKGVGGKLVDDKLASVFDLWRSVHMRQFWTAENTNPEFLFGANTVFRREALLDVGLYKQEFTSNYEDVDLSRRLKCQGGVVVYDPLAVAHHHKRDNLYTLLNTYWKWHGEFYRQKRFYDSPDNFFDKMKDNTGLARRYLQEDLSCGRNELSYLDLLLLAHHSLKDLEYFIFRDSGENAAKNSPCLSSWLAMLDLDLCYHLAGNDVKIKSLLGLKESVSLNFIAFILMLDRHLVENFGDVDFRRLFYSHLYIASYGFADSVLLEKLFVVLEEHPDWPGLENKEHLYLDRCFLKIIEMATHLIGDLMVDVPDFVRILRGSQQRVESDLCMKGFV